MGEAVVGDLISTFLEDVEYLFPGLWTELADLTLLAVVLDDTEVALTLVVFDDTDVAALTLLAVV